MNPFPLVHFQGRLSSSDWPTISLLIRCSSRQRDPRASALFFAIMSIVCLVLFLRTRDPFLLLATLMLVALMWRYLTTDSRSWSRNPRLADEQSGALSADGLGVSTPGASLHYPWPAIATYAVTSTHLVFKTTSNTYIGLASRFFRTHEEWLSLCQALPHVTRAASSTLTQPTSRNPHVRVLVTEVLRVLTWIALLSALYYAYRNAA